MTIKKTTLLILLLSQQLYAARTCVNYITDEWFDSRYSLTTVGGETKVLDKNTQLEWMQCSIGLSGVNCENGSAAPYTWAQALQFPQTLNNTFGFAGHNDWRLPNIKELQSLAALNCYNPSINENMFPNTLLDWYWSSSPFEGFGNELAWFVYFSQSNGLIDADLRTNTNYIRLVRAGN